MTIDLVARAQQLLAFSLSAGVGAYFATRYWKARLKKVAASPPPRRPDDRGQMEELLARCRAAEETARFQRRALIQIPEIAQRLFAARALREIPEVVLDLVEELFLPPFAVFYRAQRGNLVAAARRGDCEFDLGHRLKEGEGVVGWTALRQLPFTPEDAAHESRTVRERDLTVAMPKDGFTVCLPVVSGEKTVAVILVGRSVRPVEDPAELGRIVALLTSVAISSIELLQREQHLAKTDGLTGLLNKRTIVEHLSTRLGRDLQRPVSLFLFDIDFFKKYNDTNGHLAGDDLLRRLAALLRDHCRDSERLGRYGGEEFVLVMDGVPKGEALAAAERLRRLVANTEFPHRANQPGGRVTISGGVSSWPADGTDVLALLRTADEALYQAKAAGRNRVLAYHIPDLGAEGPEARGFELEPNKPR